ncbi:MULTISPECIES: TerC/Alx family metal homeostasis membrane protein [Micromonospora]|uniref:Tellurium resistance protein TerC n=1 Tax=Micromonospora chalcea TaxID=1874 RepID=A0ABX9XYV8_MICCH|nr:MULTISPECIES: TerC/Alx family metal homeostasis membrane protein [Micromonospora]EWM64023.1 membrane protein [Micromonospora sp. M42]MBP1783081.1 TerC family integral membrane protein [Micromonospora sp. HB375]MCK1807726.1 TerC/Alx family metal homeostasis membrane protein [Micromonospora sp. R42106]MCK1833063.1 TerC/Alx family metal homeostasis membrane protein [Micromonospora sp. R42003]MCK1843847.1 TerC/Alx family metal homeostasis membrane protein [Micromonospora sp. R42004]
MPELSPLAAAELSSVGTPTLWAVTIVGVLVLLVLDFLVTRKPHEVSIREALGWSAFYIALPLAFGAWIWSRWGSQQGIEYLTGYLVEKSLSVDNLFVFMLLLAAFAVPSVLAQRVLLYGIAGALVLRGVFIALGAAALKTLDFAFLLFALILVATAVKLLRDALSGHEQEVDINKMRSVRLLRKVMPVVDEYHGTRMTIRQNGRRALTPFALVVVAVLATDIVFAVDSVPAVYGITEDPYLVFATNAFALLGLRALYFVLHAALSRLVHLSYGLAVILAFIGLKLGLHWAHGIWEGVPEIPTLASLGVIIGVLVIVTITSLRATRNSGDGQRTIVHEVQGGGGA